MKTSEQINEIASAMAKAQETLKPAHKDSLNPHYQSRYADLASIWEAWQQAGPANGLAVWQDVTTDEHGVAVVTRIIHASGQWYECGPLTIPVSRQDAHGVGSATTYAKRYGLSAAVGLVADDDDDGAAAVAAGRAEPQVQPDGATKIKTVAHKTGVSKKTNKPWQRWTVEFEDGREASTFQQSMAGLAQRIHAAGVVVTPVIESPDGRHQNLIGLETDGEVPAGDGEPQFEYEGPKETGGPTEAERPGLMKKVKTLGLARQLTDDEKKVLGKSELDGAPLAEVAVGKLVAFVEFLDDAEAVAKWREVRARGAA